MVLLARFLLTQSTGNGKDAIAATECRLLGSSARGSNAKHHLRAAFQLDILLGVEQDAGSLSHPGNRDAAVFSLSRSFSAKYIHEGVDSRCLEVLMLRRKALAAPLLLCCLVANGKDKKNLLPLDVLKAHSVVVMVDPDAGVDAHDPNANRTAVKDVEKALVKWGRLTPVPEGSSADLIIVVRKSSGKVVQPTIAGTPVNNGPPVIGESTGSTTQVAGRIGRTPVNDPSDPQWSAAGGGFPSNSPNSPHPQVEVAPMQDVFAVYRVRPDPLNAPAVWRYSAKNALASPDVPAVEEFRKLVAESEK